MNKFYLFALVAIIFLPACRNKKKVGTPAAEHEKMTIMKRKEGDAPEKRGVKNLFLDDDVQEFVFEDENGSNVFSSGFVKEKSSVTLVETPEEEKTATDQKIEQSKRGFKTIYFNFDQYKVRPDQKTAIECNITAVKKHTDKGDTVVVEGHACNSAGSSVYNMLLSEKRAQSVAKEFVGNGIPSEKIKIVGRGNEMCIVPSGTREQQAPNRRVELYTL